MTTSHPLTTCPAEIAARVAATSAVEATRAEIAALDAVIAQLAANRAAAIRRHGEARAALDAINAR